MQPWAASDDGEREEIGKAASPKRGIERSGHLLLGALSGIARLTKQ